METNRPRGSDTGEFLNARVGQDLLTGDGVKTLRDSEARVDIVVLGHFRIARTKPNTIWRLGQFAVDRDTVIELDQGKIFVFDEGFREDRPTVDVVTPAGIASARGTWMSVAFDPDTGVADIQCFRGICELANDRGSVVLTDEQKSTMTAQSAPIEPQAMGEPDLLEFTQLPEAESGEVAIPAPRVPALSQASTRSTTPLPTPTPSDTPTPLITLAPADMPTSTPIPPVTEAPTSTPIPPATEVPTLTPIPSGYRGSHIDANTSGHRGSHVHATTRLDTNGAVNSGGQRRGGALVGRPAPTAPGTTRLTGAVEPCQGHPTTWLSMCPGT